MLAIQKTIILLSFKLRLLEFALEPLLPNPQFLKLFAEAYSECGGGFKDKRSIFTEAITSLAKEANAGHESDSLRSLGVKKLTCLRKFLQSYYSLVLRE